MGRRKRGKEWKIGKIVLSRCHCYGEKISRKMEESWKSGEGKKRNVQPPEGQMTGGAGREAEGREGVCSEG